MRYSVVGLYAASKSSKSPHQEQAATEGFGGADAVFEQAYQMCRVSHVEYALKRDGDELAAPIAFAKIRRRVGQHARGFDHCRSAQLARQPFVLLFFLNQNQRHTAFGLAWRLVDAADDFLGMTDVSIRAQP